jgi:hypothetical protein
MVVAEQWAEQRVLMRAYAESVDQTRPTIVLHGEVLAIGPAGTDPHGPWGIHVQPPADGRAQELQGQLELAARRLAGTRGNPPRLEDEASAFERKRTNNWAPGAPPDLPGQAPAAYFEPAVAASNQRMGAAHAHPPPPAMASFSSLGTPPPVERVPSLPVAQVIAAAPAAPQVAGPVVEVVTGAPPPRRRGWTSPVAPSSPSHGLGRTALGYSSGAGAQSAIIRLGLRPGVTARLARIVDRTVPADFDVSQQERDVLNAIGEAGQLTARAIAGIAGVPDGLAWMEQLMDKLVRHGLDLVAPGEADGSEPTYVLVR